MKKPDQEDLSLNVTLRSLLKGLEDLSEDRQEAFEEYLEDLEREEAMIEFARIISEVLDEKGLSYDQLKRRAPKGFWQIVTDRLKEAGIMNQEGKDWLRNEAKEYWKTNQEEIARLIEGQSCPESIEEPAEEKHGIVNDQNISDDANYVTRAEFDAALSELRDEIQAEIGNIPKVSEDYELAPSAPTEGKKILGPPREKLGVTIDKILMDMLEKEKKKRGVSMSRMLDTICWHFFGRPRLSFQEEGAPSGPERE